MVYIKFVLTMISDFFEQSFLGHIPLSVCPACQKPYVKTQVGQMLVEDEESQLFHLVCSFCHQAILALVTVFEQGSQTSILLTDAAREDIERFCVQDSVNVNHVLEMHRLLSTDQWTQKLGYEYPSFASRPSRSTMQASHSKKKPKH